MTRYYHIVLQLLATLVFWVAGSGIVLSQTGSQIFSSNGNFTVPVGVTAITIKAWGGGGAGGGSATNNRQGGGGGGGAYSILSNYAVAPGTVVQISVGAGGVGVTGGSGTIGAASAASIAGTPIVVANGGIGGKSYAQGSFGGTGGTGGTYNGGNGADGLDLGIRGGGGSSAGSSANGNNGSSSSTAGGIAPAGGGNGGNGSGTSVGNAGHIPGGGGGGATRSGSDATGGAGARGQVEITWTCPSTPSISYSAPLFCISSAAQSVTLTGASGGTFSSTAGLAINTSTGVITPASSTPGNYTVTYSITGTGGCPTVSSSTTVEIGTQPAQPTLISGPTAVCENSNGNSFTIAAVAKASSYIWTLPTGWTINSGDGTTSIVATAGNYLQSGIISVAAANSCGTSTAQVAEVAVDQMPTAFAIDGDATICYNNTADIVLASSQTGMSYQLKKQSDGTNVGSPVSGTGGMLILNTGALTSSAVFIVVASNGSCSQQMTGQVSILVQPQVVVQSVSTQQFCHQFGVDGIGFSATPAGTNFTWTSTADFGAGLGGDGQIMGFTAVNNGSAALNATVTVVGEYNGCYSSPVEFLVTVFPVPVIGTQDTAVCSNELLTLPPFQGSNVIPGGTVYSWSAPDPALYMNISGYTAGGALGLFAQTLTNLTPDPQPISYLITPRSGMCTGNPFTLNVLVLPVPVIPSPQNVTVCSGAPVLLNLVNSPPSMIVPPGLTYSWSVPLVTGGLTGGTSRSDANAFSQVLYNPTSVPQTATYTVTATYADCSTMFSLVVTVNPTPAISNKSVTVCSGSEFAVAPANLPPGTLVPAGTKYSWALPATSGIPGSVTGATAGNNADSIVQQLFNVSGSPQTATYVIEASAGACISHFNLVANITPKPMLHANPSVAQTICSGTNITPIVLSESGSIVGATTYYWSRSNVAGISNTSGIALSGASAPISAGGTYTISGTLHNSTTAALATTVQLWGKLNGCNTDTIPVVITVNPVPTVTITPATLPVQPLLAICDSAANTVLNFSSNMASTSFAWHRFNPGIRGLAMSGTGTGINAKLLNTTGDILTDTLVVIGTNSFGCNSITNDSIPFSVYSRLVPPVITPSMQQVCKVSLPTVLQRAENAKGGSYNYSFRWQDSLSINFPNASWQYIAKDADNQPATQPNYKPPKFDANSKDSLRFYRAVVTDNNGCGTVLSNVVIMSMYETSGSNFAPTVDFDPSKTAMESLIYCSNDSLRFFANLNNLTSGIVRYNWFANPLFVAPDSAVVPVGVDWGSSGNEYNKTYYNFAFKVFNNPRASYEDTIKKTFISIIPTVYDLDTFRLQNGKLHKLCAASAVDIAIQIFPTLKIQASTQVPAVFCNNSNVSVSLSSNIPPTLATTQFNWTASVISGTATLSNAAGTGNAPLTITETINNTGNTVAVVKFDITGYVGAANCPVDTTIFVSILPTFTAGAITPSQFICPGGDPGIMISDPAVANSDGTAVNPTYQWQKSQGGSAGPWSDISGATTVSYDPPGPIYQDTWYRRIAFAEGSCPTASDIDSVVILRGPEGIWTGLADEDWFYCMNWASGTIPDNSTNVFIRKPEALKNSNIDHLSPYYVGLPARSGDINIRRKLSFAALGLNGAARLNTWGNLTIEPAPNETDTLGHVDMQLGGEIYLRGNWINQVGLPGFQSGIGRVNMEGASLQTIQTVGADETFYDLRIDNSSDVTQGVTLLSAANVRHILTLEKGIVNTHSEPPYNSGFYANNLGLLTLKTTAVNPVQGPPGLQSFVNGQLGIEFDKAGLAYEFIYPIGKVFPTPAYRPPGIAPTTADGTTLFIAEYFPYEHPVPSIMGADPMSIIRPEHWIVEKQAYKSTQARVSIPYINPGSGNWMGLNNEFYFDPCDECNVAVVRKVLPATWHFSYAGAVEFSSSYPIEYRYYTDNGYIYSKPVTEFGPFSIGFSYKSLLPLRLLLFKGSVTSSGHVLQWRINEPAEVAQFVLEHSTDGLHFTALDGIQPNSNSQYSYLHQQPAAGNNYYRLLTKDKHGKIIASDIVLLKRYSTQTTRVQGVRTSPSSSKAEIDLYSAIEQDIQVDLLDPSGKQISNWHLHAVKGQQFIPVYTGSLSVGTYILRIRTSDQVQASVRFLKW